MSWAENNRTFASDLHLPDSVKLSLIDDNLAVDAFENLDVSVTHCFQSRRLVVGHDDMERFLAILSNFLINFILIYV